MSIGLGKFIGRFLVILGEESLATIKLGNSGILYTNL